ncbi:phage tail protein I [uncultured Desulfuromusa sp.]|uniref:phage tail protein I n=1 Tax=uncultured Desulfuromusa sp. TaxID=219183 RepID=UPI002AA6658E|nr:phage tail protein I [uncultured Desulfuromusa sp.]
MNSLLPPNATAFERAVEDVIAKRFDAVASSIATIKTLWNPWTCPLSSLPWLAWTLSVDEWESDWSEQVKRQTVAGAMEIHRHKGTPWAVEQALVLAGIPFAEVQEWFEYSGTPGHFRVVVDIEGETISSEDEARLLRYVGSAKRKSAWLDEVTYNLAVRSPVPVYALGLQSSEVTTIYPQ